MVRGGDASLLDPRHLLRKLPPVLGDLQDLAAVLRNEGLASDPLQLFGPLNVALAFGHLGPVGHLR